MVSCQTPNYTNTTGDYMGSYSTTYYNKSIVSNTTSTVLYNTASINSSLNVSGSLSLSNGTINLMNGQKFQSGSIATTHLSTGGFFFKSIDYENTYLTIQPTMTRVYTNFECVNNMNILGDTTLNNVNIKGNISNTSLISNNYVVSQTYYFDTNTTTPTRFITQSLFGSGSIDYNVSIDGYHIFESGNIQIVSFGSKGSTFTLPIEGLQAATFLSTLNVSGNTTLKNLNITGNITYANSTINVSSLTLNQSVLTGLMCPDNFSTDYHRNFEAGFNSTKPGIMFRLDDTTSTTTTSGAQYIPFQYFYRPAGESNIDQYVYLISYITAAGEMTQVSDEREKKNIKKLDS